MAFLWLLSCLALIGPSTGSGAPASDPELSIMPRIINGVNAHRGAWPWHVMLQTPTGGVICGGSLINQNWVVTAAHCNVTTSDQVVAGMFKRRSREEGVQVLNISQIFRHHDFNMRATFTDFALLRLATPAHFNNYVSPVHLPRTYDDFSPGTMCTIMGWGLTHVSGIHYARKLKQAQVPLVSMAMCKRYWPFINSRTMICAGSNGATSYRGDSGGSLVCKKNGLWTLAGVLSLSHRTCRACRPFVATRVTAFIPWLQWILASN